MSGISGASSSTGDTSTVGTDLAPITFPGIASGIDYNSIINKLTSLTLANNTVYKNQITQFNAKNAEIIKLNSMLASVQSALSALSDPSTFNAYVGSSSDSLDANLTPISGESAAPGTYTISSTQLATATQVTGSANIGTTINLNTALVSAGTAITPTNGTTGSAGSITINGVSISYDVNSQSLNTIVSHIYASVHAVDAGFSISTGTDGAITITDSDQQISIGSPADEGNLEQVLKLDTAEINNSVPPYSVTSSGPVGGVNEDAALSSSTNAGFATAVTTGTFSINGVSITVNTADDNINDVLAKINESTAGVVASFNIQTDQFSLSNRATGPQSIVLGSSKDTSNFLTAAGLTSSAGATTIVGDQAYVSLVTASGALQTVYSNSDSISGAITGMDFNVTGNTSTPFVVTVSQNANVAINAITNFVSLYNAALNEIAVATAPPVVQQTTSSTSSTTSQSSVLAAGGVLYGDETIELISDQLTQIVTGLLTNNGSTSYNSLESIGLSLDSQHSVYQSNTDAYGGTVDSSVSGPIATSTQDGTDGQFSPLDVSTFTAALAADPSAVASLFVSSSATSTEGLSNQLGAYLTGVTGNPTSLVTGLIGTIPAVSVLQGDENATTAEISSLNSSIAKNQDAANAQADLLRAQATASEGLISQYQSEQSLVNQIGSSSSSS